MKRRELISRVAYYLRDHNVRKPIRIPKQTFHISDDEGNVKDFVVKKTDKTVMYTAEDVEAIVDACLEVIKDALKKGEPTVIHGFGALTLKYKKGRSTRIPGTEEWVEVRDRYAPKFSIGNELRTCARLYELSLDDERFKNPVPNDDDDDEEDD